MKVLWPLAMSSCAPTRIAHAADDAGPERA